MNQNTYKDRLKDWRDIGHVESAMETMTAARELNSCCVGVEAVLEPNARFGGVLKRVSARKSACTAKD